LAALSNWKASGYYTSTIPSSLGTDDHRT